MKQSTAQRCKLHLLGAGQPPPQRMTTATPPPPLHVPETLKARSGIRAARTQVAAALSGKISPLTSKNFHQWRLNSSAATLW